MAATWGRPAPLPPASASSSSRLTGKPELGQAGHQALVAGVAGGLEAD